MRGAKLCPGEEEEGWRSKVIRFAGSVMCFPALRQSFKEQEGAVVGVRVVPSGCCLAAKGDFLQSNRHLNRCLRGYPAKRFAPHTEIPSRVSSAITGAVQSGWRLHQDERGGRSVGGTQTPVCRTAELAFATNLRGARQHLTICRAACFAQTDDKMMSLALFFPAYKRISLPSFLGDSSD